MTGVFASPCLPATSLGFANEVAGDGRGPALRRERRREDGPGRVELLDRDEVRRVPVEHLRRRFVGRVRGRGTHLEDEPLVGLGHAARLGGRVEQVHAARLDLQALV